MNLSKKTNIVTTIIICAVIFVLIAQLIGVILIFQMGLSNSKAADVEKMLLSEEAAWIDQSGRFKIVFSSEYNGGMIYDLADKSHTICFNFRLPGLIEFWETIPTDSGPQYAQKIYLGSVEFNYDSKAGELKFTNFNMESDYLGGFGDIDLTFIRLT